MLDMAIAAREDVSVKKLVKEIEKCDVLCVNCHAKHHWREIHESDSWKELVPEE